MQKNYLVILSLACLAAISGCGTSPTTSDDTNLIKAENIFATNTGNSFNYGENQDNTEPTAQEQILPPFNINSNTKKIMDFDASKHYTVTLHTSEGDIEIAMNFGQTPNTIKNFVDLSKKSFYNGTTFHRIMKGFMIQGGDPNGDGTGGPGYKFDDEKFTGEYTRGTVAMANSGPNTNGSQFFIMHADQGLPKNYTIFGHVTKGLDVVDKIANSKVTPNPNTGELSVPANPVKINSVTVTEK